MGVIESLGLAMGTAWTSGINLYATIAVLGIASRLQMIALPPYLEVLGHPLVITVAVVMFLIEFVTDKIPYVDNGWDGGAHVYPSSGRRHPCRPRVGRYAARISLK